MKRFALALILASTLSAGMAAAQTTPGSKFLQNWDLDGNGKATLAEIKQMRGNVFTSFDSNEDGLLDTDEYVAFDEARANDVGEYSNEKQRATMQSVADAMSLAASDLDGDGKVSREEFLKGAETWLKDLDANGDGGVTTDDFKLRK